MPGSTPTIPALQTVVDICFSASSFYVLSSVAATLVAAISSLFGLLMLSYRSRIQTAEQRERDANADRDEALRERNEALWRLDETRTQYRVFAEETRSRDTNRRYRGRQPLPPGDAGTDRRGERP